MQFLSRNALAGGLLALLVLQLHGCSSSYQGTPRIVDASAVTASSGAYGSHQGRAAPPRAVPVSSGGTAVAVAPEAAAPQVRTPVPYAPQGETHYRVVKGDTLYSIAFRYGQDYRSLAADNGIVPPYNIAVGQIIRIGGPAQVNEGGRQYTVKKGDTLTSVAREHNIPPSAIVRVNNLKYPYKLLVGEKLILANPDVNPTPLQSAEQKVVPVAGAQAAPVAPAPAAAVSGSAAPAKTDAASVQAKPMIVQGKSRKAGGIVWMWPAKGKVIKSFSQGERGNKGIDIAGNRGQNILSAADGQVVYAGSALRGYGNLIIINHANEYLSAYAHNEILLAKEGQKVKRGQVIARMGSTDAESVRLHFEIRYRGKSINPAGYLP